MKPCGSDGYDLPCSLGRYELRAILGSSTATVYAGWDPVIGRKVAIKTIDLPPEGEARDELARFRREAQAGGQLDHDNIVPVHDFGEIAGTAYIVMDLVDGRTLEEVLDSSERPALPDALRIVNDVLAALQHSHEHKVIHCDIKPANIVLTSDGRAKVADFGIARIEGSNSTRILTQMDKVTGTPGYMSPEQAEGRWLSARTDIYSMGLVVYRLLTGDRPLEGEGGMGLIVHEALSTRLRWRSGLSLLASRRVAAVIERATAERPQNRYASAERFTRALHAAVSSRNPVPAIVASAALAVAAVAVATWYLWPPPPNPDELRRSIASAIASTPCALVWGDVAQDGGSAVVNGVASSEVEARLRSAVAAAAPKAKLEWRIVTFDGPYCEALELLRPISPTFGAPGAGFAISTDGNRPELYEHDPIVIRITAPNYPSLVQLDYLQQDGTVYHMQPSSSYPAERYAPLSRHSYGEPGPGVLDPPRVRPPFGTDMVIAIASNTPLFPQFRQEIEDTGGYLRDMSGAIMAAQRRHETLTGVALVLMLRPRP